MIRNVSLSLLLAAGLFSASACSIISSTPQQGDANKQLVVEVSAAPPPEKVDARPESPGFGYIWVTGYWDSLDGNYVWRAGRWTQAKPDYEYIRARYEFDGKTWLFHRPHWKKRKAADAQPAAGATSTTPSTPSPPPAPAPTP